MLILETFEIISDPTTRYISGINWYVQLTIFFFYLGVTFDTFLLSNLNLFK